MNKSEIIGKYTTYVNGISNELEMLKSRISDICNSDYYGVDDSESLDKSLEYMDNILRSIEISTEEMRHELGYKQNRVCENFCNFNDPRIREQLSFDESERNGSIVYNKRVVSEPDKEYFVEFNPETGEFYGIERNIRDFITPYDRKITMVELLSKIKSMQHAG